MRQRARADNLTVCYRKKQMDVSFSCVFPVIANEFCHNIVKVVSYFDNVMTKFMINNRPDAWKTDVHLLNIYTVFTRWNAAAFGKFFAIRVRGLFEGAFTWERRLCKIQLISCKQQSKKIIERALKYTHFELKTIVINKSKFPKLV